MIGSPEGWLCAADCPVRMLGEQSGELAGRGSTLKKRGRTGRDTVNYGMSYRAEQRQENYGGTAARFFKTFGGEHVTEDNFRSDSREQTPQNGNHTSQNSSKDDGRRVRHNGARYQEDRLNLFTRTDTRAEVLEGDCLSVLKTMEDESVEAVVTDPPAGISFMNAEWDSNKGSRNQWIAWLTEVMEEVLRVTKPGGHALVWALPRTSHWTAMALEDAGWEVRDRVTHHFGSGFPKSANISKQIDKQGGNGHIAPDVAEALKKARTSRGIGLTKADKMFCGGTTNYSWFEGRPAGQRIPSQETFKKICEEWPELEACAERVAEAEREVIGNGKSGKTAIWAEDGMGDFDITAPATDAARQWDGYGTALKPSTEDWWLCRKPLSESSIARQVLATSTGGLNIDGCRVGSGEDRVSGGGSGLDMSTLYEGGLKKRPERPTGGRFPANLLLSHSADCVRVGEKRVKAEDRSRPPRTPNSIYGGGKGTNLTASGTPPDPDGKERVAAYECAEDCPCKALDEQSGVSKSPKPYEFNGTKNSAMFGNAASGVGHEKEFGDSGGASRFFQQFHEPDTGWGAFYCPKSSGAERNRGLEGMPEKDGGAYANGAGMPGRTFKDGEWVQTGTWQEPNRKARANNHPTVKSIKLMRYLVRLVTPPEGTVLDPFAGSGSTGVAAVHEGFDFVGIEMSEQYAEIAKRRIAHALENPEL